MKRYIASLLLLPALAIASEGSFEKTGTFSIDGYGYRLEGHYSSTAGEFKFVDTSYDKWDVADPLMQGKSFSAGLSLAPVEGMFAGLAADISVQLKVSIINLATGLPEVPPSWLVPMGTGYSWQSITISGGGGAGSGTLAPVELRFSNGRLSSSSVVSDQLGALPNPWKEWACGNANCYADWYRPEYVQINSTVHFEAGHFLSASNDPSCAWFDCMTPGHDVLNKGSYSVRMTAATVPEPSALLMVGAGVALLWLRRRRS